MPRTPSIRDPHASPRDLGFTFPAEWEHQEGVWFSWPRPEGISFPDGYDGVPENIARIVAAIIRVGQQRVHINVPNGNYEAIVRRTLLRAKLTQAELDASVDFLHVPTNEAWCRDHGPAFLVHRPARGRAKLAVVDWGFNAWGGKYPPYDADDAVPTRIAEHLKLPVFAPTRAKPTSKTKPKPIVMEGGAVDFNGLGTVLTTEACLLNPNRNPGMSRRAIERALCDFYGQRHVQWLGDGIAGDDTDGHIDDLARFLDPRTIAIAVEHDPRDENFEVLRENARRARTLVDQDRQAFSIVELPMPGVIERDGQRLPATYLNFLFINNGLLVPTFGDAARDREALAILRRHLPGRRVVGIRCNELIWGLGAIHCLTQQQPAV